MKTLNQVKNELKAGGHDGHASDSHEEDKAFVPYFVPMGRAHGADTIKCGGKEVPVHNTDVIRRGDFMWENMDSAIRSRSHPPGLQGLPARLALLRAYDCHCLLQPLHSGSLRLPRGPLLERENVQQRLGHRVVQGQEPGLHGIEGMKNG